jgi:ADP-ribose pyrophosphatase YjhB (NUDIX family)
MIGDVTMSGVPLPVWQARSFQQWYAAQVAAGNTLLNAREEWTFNIGQDDELPFYWALRVSVHVAAENRIKSNEIVISRPDISVVALYRRAATLDDTIVVLIREFRSPAATPDGFVHELPGGSGPGDVLAQAVSEVAEETGLAIDAARLRARGSRQVAATVSAHHAHLFAAEITDDELARLKAEQAQPRPHGADDSERTWTEIATFGEIRAKRLADWSTLGMIADVLLDATSGAAPPGG